MLAASCGLTLPPFLKQRPDLADLGPHGLAYFDALARPEPVLEIAIASAARAAGAFCSTVHSAPCPTSYRCLLASVTGSRPRTTAASFGQISEPSFNVGLMYGVVFQFSPPPSRSPGGLTIPTTPWPPVWM